MRNIKITIEYDGTNYAGWQTQSSSQFTVHSSQKKTIQETIEKILQKILQEKIRLIASGRTDAGVHAKGQVANFKTNSLIPLKSLQKALNSLSPKDIVITKMEEVSLDFHARFSVRSKLYRYLILNQPYRSALGRDYFYFVPYKLDLDLIRKEAKCLVGSHDFKSFCTNASGIKDAIRSIKKISIKEIKGFSNTDSSGFFVHFGEKFKKSKLILIDIEADGFLYNMVRNIVGTLLEIGKHKLRRGSLKKILLAKDREKASQTAPAQGLYLLKVRY